MLNMEQTDISFFVLDGQIKHNLGQNQHAPEVAWGQRTCQQYQYYVDCMTWNTALSSCLLWFPVCLLSGNFSIANMQFPHMKVKIAIDALECSNSNFPNFLLVQLSSSPPLITSPDLHILHQLDEFMKGTSGRAIKQATPLDLICILPSKLPDCLPLEKDCQEREQGPLCRQHPPDSLNEIHNTHSFVIQSFIQTFFLSNPQNIIAPKMLELWTWNLNTTFTSPCMSCVKCHVSCVTCHV